MHRKNKYQTHSMVESKKLFRVEQQLLEARRTTGSGRWEQASQQVVFPVTQEDYF